MAASLISQEGDEVEQKTPTRKRRRTATIPTSSSSVIDLTREDDEVMAINLKKKKTTSPRKGQDEEKRLKLFRKHPPQSYLEKLNRASGQRCDTLLSSHT